MAMLNDRSYPSTHQHANLHAFAHHTGLPASSIVMTSFCEPASAFAPSKAGPLVHYIAVDHEARAVVLACRGSLGLQDLLTDLTADYEAVTGLEHAPSGGQYYAHAGMLQSARLLTARGGAVHECLRAQLEQWPEYGLVRCRRRCSVALIIAGDVRPFARRGCRVAPRHPFCLSGRRL